MNDDIPRSVEERTAETYIVKPAGGVTIGGSASVERHAVSGDAVCQ